MSDFLSSASKQFRFYEHLGRRSLEQVSEADLFHVPAPESNSLAVIVKHLHGNMQSRWTDFLHSDGEKPWRDREGEFDNSARTKAEVMRLWEEGWQTLFHAVENLKAEDVPRTIYIRNQGHSVLEAIQRQLCHYAYHVGQMVFLAKMLRQEQWESLSIPRGGTAAFNAQKFAQEKRQAHFSEEFLTDDADET
jgi:hypothetical protein